MYRIDDELKEFLESGVAIVVGTADRDGRPRLGHGWGPRVGDNRSTVSLFLEVARAEPTLKNLADTGKIAVTFASPISYRSVQLKGHFLAQREATASDHERVQQHRDAFLTAAALVGDPLGGSPNWWMHDVLCIEFAVDGAFNQTPGPDAGNQL